MTISDGNLDRILADWLADDASQAPDAPVDAAIAFAIANPRGLQLPRVVRPNAMPESARRGRAWLLVAAVCLVLLTAGGAIVIGSLPKTTPTPSPDSAAATFRHPPVQGSTLDEALLGTWQPVGGYLVVTFHAPGAPICVERFHTDQNCMTLADPANDFDFNRGTFGGGIVVARGEALLYREIIGSPIELAPVNHPCVGFDEVIQYRMVNGMLRLEPGGACWPKRDAGWWRRPF